MPSRLRPQLLGALIASAVTASGAGAACLPEFDQPDLAAGYRVGVVQTAQGSATQLKLARDMYQVTWQRLELASPDEVRVLRDADLADPARLADLKVVVLPQTRSLSPAQRRGLLSWVKTGGGLVSLYQSGRDNERGVSLTPPAVPRKAPKSYAGWADLSPAYGATVLDMGMRQAVIATKLSNPVGQLAAKFCGAPLPDFVWKRDSSPVAITGEFGTLKGGASALATVKAARVRAGGRPVPRGANLAWTNTYGAGRVVYIGYNLMDAWRNYTFETYYEASDPNAPDTTIALLRGAVDWASATPVAPAAPA